MWPIADVEEYLASYDPIVLLEYSGQGAEPISEEDLRRCGGEKKPAQAVRIYDRLGRLEKNTKKSYQTHWNHFKAAIAELNTRPEYESEPLSCLAHPVSKVAAAAQIVVDSLKGDNLKGSTSSFQNAMIKLRECQLGIPRPGSLKEDAWFRSALETAGRVTAERKFAPEANSLLGTEETTTLKPHEYENLIDTCIRFGGDSTRSRWLAAAFISFGFSRASRCSDLCTMKYKAMFTTTQDTNPVQHCLLNVKKDGNTKTNKYGEFRGAACGHHKHAHLDLLIYDALTPGREVDFGDLVLNRREEWRTRPLFHQDNTVSADGLTALFSNQLSKAGLRNVVNRLTHLMRNTAAIRAGAHTSVDIVELLGEWKSGGSTCANSYLAKSQSSALQAHLALAGFKGYKDSYTLAHLKEINGIMQTAKYKKFAEEVLDKERRAIEKIENREESTHDAPPRVAVEVPKASIKVYASHLIAFGDCRTCSDLWNLWERERPIINSIIQRGDAKQAHGLTMQKGRLEAVVRVIARLSEERGNLQDGIQALQGVLEKLDAKEKSLGGRAGISISTFIEALQGVVNTTAIQKFQSAIKGRTKVTMLDLKNMLDAHWETTTGWPAVEWAEAD
ncbi:hypothetical protein KSW81_006004 [Nannochloris sp. 'desiccata']|nr:hypothetical protein KSW81_006004 [Chlorella desiccata (nom. nud.)]